MLEQLSYLHGAPAARGILKAEASDRATRSISHQMKAARFPIHRDLAGFDFAIQALIEWFLNFGR